MQQQRRLLPFFAALLSVVTVTIAARQSTGTRSFQATGTIVRVPGESVTSPCFISVDSWQVGSWREQLYDTLIAESGTPFQVPAGTRVKEGQRDESTQAQQDVQRVVYALETALAFSEDMQTKVRDACKHLGTWINVRVVRDDPTVDGGMYGTGTNTAVIDIGDLDAERFIPHPDAGPEGAIAARLAKSQNIRTTLAHEIDHMRGPDHKDPLPEDARTFIGLPGIDENRVMEDLNFDLVRLDYVERYRAYGTELFLRSPIGGHAHDSESHRFESGAMEAIDSLGLVSGVGDAADSDRDGVPDTADNCPDTVNPAQAPGCTSVPDDRAGRRETVTSNGASVRVDRNPDGTTIIDIGHHVSRPGSPLVSENIALLSASRFSSNLSPLATVGKQQTQVALIENADGTPGTIIVPANPGRGDAAYTPSIKVYFVSLGESTGDAVQMTVINDGNVPVHLTSGGFSLVPLENVTVKDVERAMRAMGNLPGISVTLKAYCLDMTRPVPARGTVMALAPDNEQANMMTVQQVLTSSRHLLKEGKLEPVVDEATYRDSIRQWSLWTWRESLDQRAYTTAFINHTRKNLEASGERWEREYDAEVRTLAAKRWRDIRQVLDRVGVR